MGRHSDPLLQKLLSVVRELVDRNNYLASETFGIPIELQLAIKLMDDPADHPCAEALATGRLNGRTVCLSPVDCGLRLITPPLD